MSFFFNDTATTEIYTLSLHDALPICVLRGLDHDHTRTFPEDEPVTCRVERPRGRLRRVVPLGQRAHVCEDRKSTRLNSSHANISYAVFCLKKTKMESHAGAQLQTQLA